MTQITPTTLYTPYKPAINADLHNPGLILEHQGHTYHLLAGTSDKIHIFIRSICLYVLTINKPLGYIGLDAYLANEPDPINSVFLHSEHQIIDALGKKWNQMNPCTMATRLIDYLL